MSDNMLKIGHLSADQEALIGQVPVNEGQIIYSEKSSMQFVDYADKRHTHGSILSGIYHDSKFVDFQTVKIDEVLSAIKANGFVVDGQIIKVGNTVYQYRNVKGKNIIIKTNETSIVTNKHKVCYAVYLPDYVEGDSVSIDFLISIENNIYGDKIYYVKVQDNKLDISQCDDMDETFNPDEFGISIIHNGDGLFALSTIVSSNINIISCTVSSTGSATHEQFYIMNSDIELINEWVGMSNLPYEFSMGSAVVFKDDLYLLGGTNNPTNYYKWDGSEWISLPSLPFDFDNGNVVVCEDTMYILGGTNHYKLDGASWVEASILPVSLDDGCAVVYRDEIHILGNTNHYKWNGNTHIWEKVSTLPYEFANGCAIVFNDELHMLGGTNNGNSHYKWNGTEWANASELPVSFTSGCAALYNGVINLYGGDNSLTYHYNWDGKEWISISTLPYEFNNGSVVIYKNELHLLGGGTVATNHYKYSKSVK